MNMSIDWNGMTGAEITGAGKRGEVTSTSKESGSKGFEKLLADVNARTLKLADSGMTGKELAELRRLRHENLLEKAMPRNEHGGQTEAPVLHSEHSVEAEEAAISALMPQLPSPPQPLPELKQTVAASPAGQSGRPGSPENAMRSLAVRNPNDALLTSIKGGADAPAPDATWRQSGDAVLAMQGKDGHAAGSRQIDLPTVERSLVMTGGTDQGNLHKSLFHATSANGSTDQSAIGMPGTASMNTVSTQAGTSPTASPLSGAGMSLSAAVDSQEWQQELGNRMASLARRGGQSVSLQLNPPELGPLLVDLKVSEQQAQLQFLSAQPQVRGAVEQAIPQLREALAEQGISLGQTTVGEQHRDEEQDPAMAHGRGDGQPHTNDAHDDESASEESAGEPAEPIDVPGRVNLYI